MDMLGLVSLVIKKDRLRLFGYAAHIDILIRLNGCTVMVIGGN